jgi:hypothetical protein
MSPPPTFHASTGLLHFSVPLAQGHVTAFISQSTWQARHGSGHSDSSMIEIYLANLPMIHDAVMRKLNAGSRIPVVLKAADL